MVKSRIRYYSAQLLEYRNYQALFSLCFLEQFFKIINNLLSINLHHSRLFANNLASLVSLERHGLPYMA